MLAKLGMVSSFGLFTEVTPCKLNMIYLSIIISMDVQIKLYCPQGDAQSTHRLENQTQYSALNIKQKYIKHLQELATTQARI